MSALIVQSRFAGLKVEDDEGSPTNNATRNNKIIKTNNVKKPEPAKKTKNNNAKTQSATKKKKAKQVAISAEQWELWKQKDEELVDGNFEDELHQAIILSKLDFEEKKDVNKHGKKDTDKNKVQEEQAAKNKSKKQQKKKNVMSLDQFNDMMNGEDTKSHNESEKDVYEENKSPDKDTEFFERVKVDTKRELFKDKIIDRVRTRLTASDEVINRVQYLDALEKKDEEIEVLRQEVTKLKQELLTVKSRNKKLCNILGQGEMKDKAEVLVEVERLRAVQSELTSELASLHTDLEKERSKNTDPRAKDKKSASKKKNIRFDVSSEAIFTKESSSGTAG